MEAILLVGILILNVAISTWNCYAAGTAWKDVMAMGTGFEKLLLRSAVFQAGVGFSMPIIIVLAYASMAYLSAGEHPKVTPMQAEVFMKGVFSLWYVAIILPLLGSGCVIWIHSLREAYRRRDFASIATAGWNSFAQIHNTVSAAQNISGALGDVSTLASGAFDGDGDLKDKLFWIAVLIVVIALVGGFSIALALTRYFSRTSESRIEAYAQERFGRRTA